MLKDHSYYMKMALGLALKAKGRTSPNPLVGALVVKNNKVVGGGYHEKAGLSHAELVALNEAGPAARGATLYVTLEPCAHYGRTPPCVDEIIRSGIKHAVVAMVDPNPLVNGKGIAILKQNNIKVELGILGEEAERINEVYIKSITKKLPFVTVKVAESLDGKIATRNGDSKWITCDKSRSYAHKIRQDYDAIMVGVNTVLRDDPKLDTWFSKRRPVKVVVDSQLSTPPDANIFSAQGKVL
ncbi:MAG: bifunctional diaminohydroxyphosphoribosylaminopyrimidine deaminase/5-amino-6-(5-phosphoribosylamino)uracil reductase RibD, partial [Candidatus Omnitrophota bacterium]